MSTEIPYWEKMMEKAARNIAAITECEVPETEHDVKEQLEHVLRYGSHEDVAIVVAEVAEWQTAHLMSMSLEQHQ